MLNVLAWPLVAVLSSPCDVPLDPPEVTPLDASVHYGSIYDWAGRREDAQLGIGHLKLHTREDIWDWWHRIAIPFYRAPEGGHWGWFVNGSLVDVSSESGVTPIGTSGMVETGYETTSFIVLEERGGWLRLRFGKPGRDHDGTAWTHACHVESEGLEFEPWESRFTSGEISPLTFRSEVPHALRSGPAAGATRVHWIRDNHVMEPLELDGDWMRVRVSEPSDYCAGREIEVVRREGWVRWRSADKGPWVWYFTRGC